MPVQMIELEEVAMMGVSDAALEALISTSPQAQTIMGSPTCQGGSATDGCPW